MNNPDRNGGCLFDFGTSAGVLLLFVIAAVVVFTHWDDVSRRIADLIGFGG